MDVEIIPSSRGARRPLLTPGQRLTDRFVHGGSDAGACGMSMGSASRAEFEM